MYACQIYSYLKKGIYILDTHCQTTNKELKHGRSNRRSNSALRTNKR